MLRRPSHLLRAATIVTCACAAACGGTPTSPSGAVLQSLTVVGPSGAGGVILRRNETGTGTVTLSAVAPANGAVITLQTLGAERNALIVPSAVTIARGSMSASFPLTVTSSGVSGPAEVTLTATYGGRTQSLVIRLEP
jgi:hypothetical protein